MLFRVFLGVFVCFFRQHLWLNKYLYYSDCNSRGEFYVHPSTEKKNTPEHSDVPDLLPVAYLMCCD